MGFLAEPIQDRYYELGGILDFCHQYLNENPVSRTPHRATPRPNLSPIAQGAHGAMSGDAERDAELALLREKLARSELLVTDLRTAANVNAESHLASRIATAKTLAIVQAELEASETKLVRAEKTIARMGLEGAPPPSPVPPAPARSSLATASSELPGLADYTRRLPTA